MKEQQDSRHENPSASRGFRQNKDLAAAVDINAERPGDYTHNPTAIGLPHAQRKESLTQQRQKSKVWIEKGKATDIPSSSTDKVLSSAPTVAPQTTEVLAVKSSLTARLEPSLSAPLLEQVVSDYPSPPLEDGIQTRVSAGYDSAPVIISEAVYERAET